MKNKPLPAFLALLFFALTAPPASSEERFGFGRDIFVGKDEVQDNIIAFGGNIVVEGRIKENIVAFGGTIVLSGEVGDSVVGFGTTITLRPTAVVKGDVASIGGKLEKEPGCVISGDTVYVKGGDIFPRLFRKGWLGLPLVPFIIALKIVSFFIWLLIALVIGALFSRQLEKASGQIKEAFGSVIGVGALGLVCFISLIILFALLSIILIGIPFLLLLIIVGGAIKVFGEVVLFFYFGDAVGRAIQNRAPAPIVAVMIGLVVVSLIKAVPVLGFLASIILACLAWGAVIRTKFGTTENWFRRKAA